MSRLHPGHPRRRGRWAAKSQRSGAAEDGRAARPCSVRSALLRPLGPAPSARLCSRHLFVEHFPTRIGAIEFFGERLQALQRLAALILVVLEYLRIADQRRELHLFGFQALNLVGQLRQLALLVV